MKQLSGEAISIRIINCNICCTWCKHAELHTFSPVSYLFLEMFSDGKHRKDVCISEILSYWYYTMASFYMFFTYLFSVLLRYIKGAPPLFKKKFFLIFFRLFSLWIDWMLTFRSAVEWAQSGLLLNFYLIFRKAVFQKILKICSLDSP